ncbi:MAG: hypothetical protein KAW12_07700 [Candidatus Aminicenantes bacterium]|nr:hypothetical protein [Candidatus Aminicenantes bacterium]
MKRILLIEDEKEMNFRLINRLKEIYDVVHARSINAAINALELSKQQGKEFDLTILDIMMSPGSHYTTEETNEGIETGWVFYKDKFENLNTPVVIWTRNRDIFVKPWGPNVVEKLIKSSNSNQLVDVAKKHLGE